MLPNTPRTAFWTPFRLNAAVTSILVLAAVLRLVNLRTIPGWYHDECIYVQQVANLMRGVLAWDNVAHSFLPRLPFMHLLVMPFFAIAGADVLWVRFVTALCGILGTGVVYLLAREIGFRGRAIAAAAAFALLPYAVLINRWGFSYNLDMLLGALNVYCLQRFARDGGRGRFLWLAALAAGLSTLVDPIMLSRLVLMGVVAALALRTWRGIASVAISAIPLTGYCAWMLAFRREVFLEDVQVILGQRVLDTTLPALAQALWDYLSTYSAPWLAVGAAGLFMLPAGRATRILLAAFALDLAFILKSSGPDATIVFRMGIVLAPALSIGIAAALAGTCRKIAELASAKDPKNAPLARLRLIFARMAPMVAGAAAVLCLAWPSVAGVNGQFRYNYNEACIFDIADADATARWMNARLKPDDVVISTHVNWMLNAQVTSPMIVDLLYSGQRSPIYFSGLAGRTLRDISLERARFAIVHEATPGMLKHYHFDRTQREIVDRWKIANQQGLFTVYENPLAP